MSNAIGVTVVDKVGSFRRPCITLLRFRLWSAATESDPIGSQQFPVLEETHPVHRFLNNDGIRPQVIVQWRAPFEERHRADDRQSTNDCSCSQNGTLHNVII